MPQGADHLVSRLLIACKTRRGRLADVAGIIYIVLSLWLSFAVLGTLSTYLADDTLWPDFSTISPVVSTLFNLELATAAPGSSFDLLTGIRGGGPLHRGTACVWTTLPAVVQSLRLMGARDTNNLVTLYCWADLRRQWAMAYTAKRQARCEATMSTNAAVHLEAVLRNVDLHGWILLNNDAFFARIGEPIAATGPDGREWLETLLEHEMVAIDAEVLLWQQCGLETFRMQVANGYQQGATESLSVENALGATSQYQLKSVPTATGFYSMMLLNELLYIDFMALFANQSIVRNTTNYFDDVLVVQNFALGFALTPLNVAFVNKVGNFGNVDAWWIPPPASLVASVRTFRAAIVDFMLVDMTFSNAVSAIGSVALAVTPDQWADPSLAFYGGSIICPKAPLLPQVQESFSYYAVCGSQNPLTVPWHAWNSLYAFAAHLPSNDSMCNQGASPKHAAGCRARLEATATAFRMMPARPFSFPAAPLLAAIGISQAVANASNVSLQMQPLLDPSYAFFGMMSFYDWVMGQREVIALEGDGATLYIMSPMYPPMPQTPSSASAAFAPYVWYISAVVSVVLAAVALLVLGLWVCARPRTTEWFIFHRMASSVWLGRSALVVRSLGATAALATAPVVTRTTNGVIHLSAAPRHPVVSLVLAGETTWLVYVVQELLSPIMRPTWAPVASGAAWLVVALLDISAPVGINATVYRRCEILDINTRIRCMGGSLDVGAAARAATIVAICVLIALVSMMSLRRQHTGKYNLLLSSTAATFLTDSTSPLDVATIAMCGVLVAPGNRVFDTKLWRTLQASERVNALEKAVQHPSDLTPAGPMMRVKQATSRLHNRLRRVTVVTGAMYLGGTLVSNVAYVRVIQDALANDFGWSGFNTTGIYAFLANTFNHQLILATSNTIVPVASPAYGDINRVYNGSDLTVSWSEGAVRRLLYDPQHIVLNEVVVGLRSMDPCQLPWMFTQYCWLDFGRQWAMASTAERQQRCSQQQQNGAVYLEAALRNLNDWDTWLTCWGNAYIKAIQEPLVVTKAGQTWLTATTTVTATVAEELEHWMANGIKTFVLQWQNYKTTAFSDTFAITSALGLQYTLPISTSTGGMHLDAQTSMRLYWAWANDLLAVNDNSSVITGRSLLRGTADFAFTNVTSQSLLHTTRLLPSPLSGGLTLFTRTVGPFGAVDAIFVPCPLALHAYYGGFTQKLTELLLTNAEVQAAHTTLTTPMYVGDLPLELLAMPNLTLTGGNLLCGDDADPAPLVYLIYAGFGSAQLCSTGAVEYMTISKEQRVFAMHGYSSNHVMTRAELANICSINMISSPSCIDVIGAAAAIATNHTELSALTPLALAARAAVAGLNVTIVQYVLLNNSITRLVESPLFDATGSVGDINGWYLAYEWAAGLREVVSFQGDVGSVTTLSAGTMMLSMSLDTSLVGANLSFLFLASVLYVTYILIGVSAIAMGYAIKSRGRIEGLNLLELNRIVGHAWIGRPLLILRSVTALWLLNTSPLALTQVGLGTQLTAQPVAWYKTALAASELTWIVYILNDVLSCVTRQHTPSYATASALCTWMVMAVWTFVAPHTCRVAVDRTCTYVNMDSGLVCASGVVEVGSLRGVIAGVGVVGSCVIICAAVDIRCRPHLAPVTFTTLLLNASSYYMMNFTYWHRDNEYFLDQASGVLAGLISLHWRGNLYILDVKSWRCILAMTDDNPEGTMRRAIPLSRIG
ncbi:hypothetical protein ACHHYP_15199 [Achlya hypogyna]|uniref:Transmembrane protein n=1 Tax=Achlya hypogyna TaxID=1202772 RepID=A0A1V9YBD8_ACHHY|nr:hypothetical protein ACHHYP_15199 [Achlya hypogyna]